MMETHDQTFFSLFNEKDRQHLLWQNNTDQGKEEYFNIFSESWAVFHKKAGSL